MARATSALPVPRSPRRRTGTSVSATRPMTSATGPKEARPRALGRVPCRTRNVGPLTPIPRGSCSVISVSAMWERRSPFLQSSKRGATRRSCPADARLLDLVEQRLVADAEDLRGLPAVPVHLPERVLDCGAFRFHRRGLGDRGQRASALRCLRSFLSVVAASASAGTGVPAPVGSVMPAGIVPGSMPGTDIPGIPSRRRRRPSPARRRRPPSAGPRSPQAGRRRSSRCCGGSPRRPAARPGGSTIRLIMFSSSRMLPGQS